MCDLSNCLRTASTTHEPLASSQSSGSKDGQAPSLFEQGHIPETNDISLLMIITFYLHYNSLTFKLSHTPFKVL